MSTLASEQVKLRDGREVVIRPAVLEDAEAIIRFMTEGLPEYMDYIVTRLDEFDPAKVIAGIHEQNEATGQVFLLAEADGEIVGDVQCFVRTRQRIAHIGEVGIWSRKAYWDTGLGTAMMAKLIDWAEPHPVLEVLKLVVYADNARAIRLYTKFGFKEAGRMPRGAKFGPGVYKDDVIMYRRVDGSGE